MALIPVVRCLTLVALVRAPTGSIAAGVGTLPPAGAGRRIATGLRRAIAPTSSASAWREPLTLFLGRCAVSAAWGGVWL